MTSGIPELVAGLEPHERVALLAELVAAIAREAAPAVAAEPVAPEEPWPHAMRIDQASAYTGYSDDHLRKLANAGRAGHRLDGDPASNAPWVFLRSDLDRVLREDRDEYQDNRAALMAPKRGRRRHREGVGVPR